MVRLRLASSLARLAEGHAEHELPGETIGAVLRAAESRHPNIAGWILDEQGRVRRHVNVFLNGERVTLEASVADGDEVYVLPAISGGEA